MSNAPGLPYSAALNPLPAPGIAILPQYITQTSMQMTKNSNNPTATLLDGRPLFTISKGSHTRDVIDATTNIMLFRLVKHGSAWTAELNGAKLFDMPRHTSDRHTAVVRFTNQADASRPYMQIEYALPSSGRGVMTCAGMVVASVTDTSSSAGLRTETERTFSVAAGMDPTLVLAVDQAVCADKKGGDLSALKAVTPFISLLGALSGVPTGAS